MNNSRSVADLLLERAEVCLALFGMAADSPQRTAAAKRLREIHADPAVARILGSKVGADRRVRRVQNGSMAADVTRRRAIDAAFDMVLDAVRHSPDEVAAAIDKLAAKYGPERANNVLDAIERRFGGQLPHTVRDAARPVEQCGHG
jgi:hypothetical protein